MLGSTKFERNRYKIVDPELSTWVEKVRLSTHEHLKWVDTYMASIVTNTTGCRVVPFTRPARPHHRCRGRS